MYKKARVFSEITCVQGGVRRHEVTPPSEASDARGQGGARKSSARSASILRQVPLKTAPGRPTFDAVLAGFEG